MRSDVVVVMALRVLLVALFLGLVVGQALSVPGQFSSLGEEAPALASLRWPLTVIGVLVLLCLQVVVVSTWRLLSMVRTDRIFSTDAFAWVDAIVWSVTGAWLLYLAGSGSLVLTVVRTPELRDPGVPMALLGLGLVGGVVVLLMVVLRALLRQAAALRTDMDAVI